jgi:3-methyladenine DNA glycosylase AlkD
MTPATDAPSRSEATARAVAFVAAHREQAERLGRSLADTIYDPDAFARELEAGFAGLADPEYLEGEQRVAPGLGPVLGVRWPLNAAVARGFREAARGQSPTTLLFVADRLFRSEPLEIRWFAFGILEQLVVNEPERTWQLLRRAAREAGDWITVDTLAHPYGRGILLEPYRWAELEQLVFSPNRWERRLVGSTIATMPFIDRRRGRQPEVASHGLELIDQLIGDDQPDVQKALSWALRSLIVIDAEAVAAFLAAQTETAQATGDGHRAWVIRDTVPKLSAATANDLRARLDGIRRRPGAPSTSRAAETAAQFAGMGLGRAMPEPPLT